jgi:YggT family protein
VQAIGVVIELVLWFFIMFLLARLVADYVQMFARSWEPKGFILVVMELLYSVTDPPIRLLRRLVPPIRMGGISLDLSLLIVLLLCYILQLVNRSTLLTA